MKFYLLLFALAAALEAADSPIPPAMNAFTGDSYKLLARGDANLILSPFNIATALSMALAGARGRTAEEIQAVLHAHYDAAYDAALGGLLADLMKAGNTEGNELLAANALWAQRGLTVQPGFAQTLENNYHAPLTLLDFLGNAEAARAEINQWTEERTKEKIKNLFAPGSLTSETRMVLTSAIYFYGKWQTPFVSARTQPAPFTLAKGGSVQANFMNQTAEFGYAETPGARILEMRYAGTGMAFDVLLPNTGSDLASLEGSMTGEKLAGWLGGLATHNVQVSLPKFRVESEFSLKKQLSAMGMPTAFTGRADFSGMAAGPGLAISDVAHKAFVDVSEKGTEAAAATGTAMYAAMRMPERPVVFRADHPFVFLIRDTRTGTMLFIGRVMDPRN